MLKAFERARPCMAMGLTKKQWDDMRAAIGRSVAEEVAVGDLEIQGLAEELRGEIKGEHKVAKFSLEGAVEVLGKIGMMMAEMEEGK